MNKEIWKKALFGIPLGITIGQIVLICISYALGGSEYYPCVPALTEACGGNELTAVLLQLLICAGYGALCSAASIIWSLERWSLLQRTAVFFALLLGGMLGAGYGAYWMPRTGAGIARYIFVFAAIFAVIWIIEYGVARRRARELNAGLAKSRGKGE